MRKLAAVLVVLFIASLLPVVAAQLGSSDWPKHKHDAYNSGRSSTTVVASPLFKWITPLSDATYTSGGPTLSEPILDGSGNVYVVDIGPGAVHQISPTGSLLWRSTAILGSAYYGTATLWNDGTNDYILTGAGWTAPYGVNFINPATGASDFFTETPFQSDLTPSIGPDGTIYAHSRDNLYTLGNLVAIDPATKAIKWTYGTGTGEMPIAGNWGGDVVTTIDDGGVTKNLVIHGGRTSNADSTTVNDLIAVVDEGSYGRLLWSATIGLHSAGAALSNDGQTVYCLNANSTGDNFIALDVLTGVKKWGLNTGNVHSRTFVIGDDGTIYISSNNATSPNISKLIAVTDNGTSGAIKWSLPIPDNGLCTTPAVTSSNPAVVYFGSSNGWFYAVRDDATAGTIIWRKWRFLPTGTAAPGPACIAADGTVYTQFGTSLVAFQPGFTTTEDYTTTISGNVKNTNGAPVNGAYVSLSASNAGGLPLIRNNFGYIRTDGNGNYSITVQGLDPGDYYISTWARGYLAADTQTVSIQSGQKTASVSFTLQPAGFNVASSALGATVTCNNEQTAQPGSFVIDGNPGTRWITIDSSASYPSATNPAILQVDLGGDVEINQAVFYWEFSCAGPYKLQCLSNAYDPTVESNWTDFGTTLYSSTTNVPMNAYPGIFWNGAWTDVIKFAPANARYWRLYITYGFSGRSRLVSMWEMELNLASSGGSKVGDIKSMDAGAIVQLAGKRITGVAGEVASAGIPAKTMFVEESDRSSSIRVDTSNASGDLAKLGIGDTVDAIGKVQKSGDETFVTAAIVSKGAATRPLDAVGMTINTAGSTLANGMFVKLVGKVTEVGGDYFTINDGSPAPIKVMCGDLNKPSVNDMVKVRGVIGTDVSGTVLYMRNEMVDWAMADAVQPLPFPGLYKYLRDYLILGVYTDNTKTDEELLDIDFISNATGGALSEANIEPSAGDAVGSISWIRYDGQGELVELSRQLGACDHCVAYAHVYVWSPVTVPILLNVGGDDSLKVLVNGMEAVRQLGPSSVNYGLASDYAYLESGWNKVLFKVVNMTGNYGLVSQFATSYNGSGWGMDLPLEGLGYMINKP